MRRIRVLTLAAASTVVLALGGCGDDGGEPGADGSSAPTVASVRPALVALWTAGGAGDTATGECFADALLARVDPADLVEAGVLDVDGSAAGQRPSLDPETAAAWTDAQFACSDFVEGSARALDARSGGKLDALGYAKCLRSKLSEQQQRDAVEQSLQGNDDDPAVTRLRRAQRQCASTTLVE